MVELSNRKFIPLDETTTWNFQQGAMMQWLPNSTEPRIIFNDRIGKNAVAVILDVHSRERRTLGRAISALSHDGKTALSLNFGRLQRTRPGYGYPGIADPFEHIAHPLEDGIYKIDLATGEETRVVTLANIFDLANKPSELGRNTPLYFNHTIYNKDDSRFAFFLEWTHYPLPKIWRLKKLGRLRTALYTIGANGRDLRCLIDFGKVSHYDWRNNQDILIWARIKGHECFHLVTDGTGTSEPVGEALLTSDGHCSFSPDGHWVLVDTYPDQNHLSTLKLYNWDQGTQVILGKYYANPANTGEIRCDLHPRWNRTGTEICFDSIHEGTRQIYTLDVSTLT
ncbi:MAG: hypothetical protein ABSD49_11410 [Candidatus Bathyarchaeia archaeon]|jgi:hypothetical protein